MGNIGTDPAEGFSKRPPLPGLVPFEPVDLCFLSFRVIIQRGEGMVNRPQSYNVGQNDQFREKTIS
ncbi:MAG: hypothetical protein ACLFPU_10780, partial [Dehalococcoidia bacterium]